MSATPKHRIRQPPGGAPSTAARVDHKVSVKTGDKESKGVSPARRGRPPTGAAPSDSPHRVLRVRLSVAHMRILETESTAWGTNRSHFLEILLKTRLGLLPVTKAASLPYKFKAKELDVDDYIEFSWYTNPTTKGLLEKDMKRQGLLNAQACIVSMLNDWIGHPRGLPLEEPAASPRRSPSRPSQP